MNSRQTLISLENTPKNIIYIPIQNYDNNSDCDTKSDCNLNLLEEQKEQNLLEKTSFFIRPMSMQLLTRESSKILIFDEKNSQKNNALTAFEQKPRALSAPRKILLSEFTPIKFLGSGTFSKVALVKHNSTNKIYAMKIVEKRFIEKVYFH